MSEFIIESDDEISDVKEEEEETTLEPLVINNFEAQKLNIWQEHIGKVVSEPPLNNYFITGGAKTGKTFLCQYLYNMLKKDRAVVLTSVSAVNCLNMGGTLFYKLFNYNLLITEVEKITKDQLKNVKEVWKSIDTIIIDDINLLEQVQFVNLMFLVQECKLKIQWILVGDFAQLKPSSFGLQHQVKYCFEFWNNDCPWDKIIHENFILAEPIQNMQESSLFASLAKIRLGELSGPELSSFLKQRFYEHLIESTEKNEKGYFGYNYPLEMKRNIGELGVYIMPCLLGFNKDRIIQHNQFYYYQNEEDGEEEEFRSIYGQVINNDIQVNNDHKDKDLALYSSVLCQQSKIMDLLKKNCPAPEKLLLKPGTQVILLVDLWPEKGLHRGALGKVVMFSELHSTLTLPIVQWANGLITIVKYHMWTIQTTRTETRKLFVSRLPLDYGWAYHALKTISMNIDYGMMDMEHVYEPGVFYFIFSRFKKWEDFWIFNHRDPKCLITNEAVKEFYQKCKEKKVK